MAPLTCIGAPDANRLDSPVNFFTPLQLRGNAISSGDNFINSFLNSCIKVFSIFSSPSMIILSASLIFSLHGAGVLDLTASIPMIFNFGSLYLTPSLSQTLRIYLFFAVHTPLSAMTSRAMTIFWSYAFISCASAV